MSDPIKYITTCRVCRKEILKAAPFVPVVNGTPDPRLMKFGMALFQHMATEHQEVFGAILMVACYQITDPLLCEQLEMLRWSIHGHTSKNFVADNEIQDKLAAAGVREEDMKDLLPLVIDLRDYLTET